jgi:hypothetical protein
MSFISQMKLAEFKTNTARNPIVHRRQKLVAKIDEQIKLAADSTYKPTKILWTKDDEGKAHKTEQPKRIKCWWVEQLDGSVLLTVRYGSKPLELAKGKNAIQLANKADVEAALQKLKVAVAAGELDSLLGQQIGFGKRAGKAGLQP